ncbi:MAG: hypothetical protein ACLR02_10045 [Clostridium sp.]
MINIKVSSNGVDDIDIKVEKDTSSKVQAFVEAMNIIIAVTEILYNVYDKKFPISFRWLEEELIE